MPITAKDVQNIINMKDYTRIYFNPEITAISINLYSLSIQTNGQCGKNVPDTSFIWIKSHKMNSTDLYCEFQTGFSSPLNSVLSEIADLLYFYQL
jgi:hypothetical protein